MLEPQADISLCKTSLKLHGRQPCLLVTQHCTALMLQQIQQYNKYIFWHLPNRDEKCENSLAIRPHLPQTYRGWWSCDGVQTLVMVWILGCDEEWTFVELNRGYDELQVNRVQEESRCFCSETTADSSGEERTALKVDSDDMTTTSCKSCAENIQAASHC